MSSQTMNKRQVDNFCCRRNILIGFVRVVQNLKYWKFISASTFSWSFGKMKLQKMEKNMYFLEAHLDMSVCHQSFYEYLIVSYISLFFSCCQTNRANYILPVFCFEQNGCRGLQWLGPAACAPLTISSVGQKLMQLSELP